MEERKQNIDITVLVVGFILILILGTVSCSPNGWGCHGRGKIMTRVR